MQKAFVVFPHLWIKRLRPKIHKGTTDGNARAAARHVGFD